MASFQLCEIVGHSTPMWVVIGIDPNRVNVKHGDDASVRDGLVIAFWLAISLRIVRNGCECFTSRNEHNVSKNLHTLEGAG